MITYQKGSLFEAPKGSILAHSCNCHGVWGAGIALEFAKKFPGAYQNYQWKTLEFVDRLMGTAAVFDAVDYTIVSLFVSIGYGRRASHPMRILKSTENALNDLVTKIPPGSTIHVPKINSGLFRVPWEMTESILDQSPYNFVVWTPKL